MYLEGMVIHSSKTHVYSENRLINSGKSPAYSINQTFVFQKETHTILYGCNQN